MGMTEIVDAVMSSLRGNLRFFCDMEEVGGLSEDLIIKLLVMNDELEDVTCGLDDSDEEKDEDEENTILRFRVFVKWLAVNSMAADKKAETLALFDFDDFTIRQLGSVVKDSGLYSKDKIIRRMEELYEEQEEELETLKRKNRSLKRKINAKKN